MATAPPIVCPHCQKAFKGSPGLVGKRIRCKSCEKPFVVKGPGGDEGVIDLAAAAVVPPAGKTRPPAPATVQLVEDDPPEKPMRLADDDDGAEKAYGVTTLDLTPRCPNCANEMESEDAVVCLHCGYNTQTRTWGKTEKVYETTGYDMFMWLLPGILCLIAIILQVVGCLYYCLVLPNTVARSDWFNWSSHESLRMWSVIFALFDMWALGIFCYLRLIVHPVPPEKKKE